MSKKNSERGFFLIEVLVVMVIMGIVLFVFFNIININNKVNIKNDIDIIFLNYV